MNSFCVHEDTRNIRGSWLAEDETDFSGRREDCNNVWQFVLPVGIGGLIALSGSLLTRDLVWAAAFPFSVLVACHVVRNSVLENSLARKVDLHGWTRWWGSDRARGQGKKQRL